jgi:hypothetical protein
VLVTISASLRSSEKSDLNKAEIIVDKAVDRDQVMLIAGEAIRDWFTEHPDAEDSEKMVALAESVIRCSRENSKLVAFLQRITDRS